MSELIKKICYSIFLMNARIIDTLPYKTTIIPKRIYNTCKDMYKNCIGKDYNKDIF